ncbi:MAG: STAS domain-containing protein [Burkholderiaceae bacterium]|jgi:hypothetical protein|nr:STAS domain-containing protein [Burkholderiaceae bacterium]
MGRQSGSSSGGLLSKMVKFVKNPTVQWSDLNSVRSGSTGDQSHQALQEMIERKRRNDFVRNRELDMLRKLRRKKLLAQEDRPTTSSDFGDRHANSGERARTLEKIDEIEAQMSSVWLRHQGGQEQTGADKPLSRSQDGGPERVNKFDASEQSPATYPIETQSAAMPEDELPPTALEARTPLAPTRVGLSDTFDFQVDALAKTAKLDPVLEEAVIRFANGDSAGAEARLYALVAEGGTHEDDAETWLTLLDFYRATAEQGKFNDAAPYFAARFGRLAPQWETSALADSHPVETAGAGMTRVELAGEMLRSADSALRLPGLSNPARSIEFNCRELRRVDFGAAGDLLNWSMSRQAEGRQVIFCRVNRMVAAFFGVIGLTEVAHVEVRLD